MGQVSRFHQSTNTSSHILATKLTSAAAVAAVIMANVIPASPRASSLCEKYVAIKDWSPEDDGKDGRDPKFLPCKTHDVFFLPKKLKPFR